MLHDPDDFAAFCHGRFLIDEAVTRLAGLHLGTCEHCHVAADGSLRRCGDTGVRTRSATVPRLFYVMCPRHGGDPERGDEVRESDKGQRLCRGMVLVDAQPGGYEAGIVLGPAKYFEGAFTVVHGYIDRPPMCGLFEVWPKDVPHVWRRATPGEAAKVRALLLAHAEAWGPDSNGWVAKIIPLGEQPEAS